MSENVHAAYTTAAAVGHAAAEHGAHAAASHAAHPEVLTWVGLLAKMLGPGPVSDALLKYEKVLFAAIIVSLLSFFVVRIASRRTDGVPGRAQAFLEMLVSGLDDFVQSVMGPRGRRYTPFLGTLFIYILVSNLFGLIPLQNSIMGYLTTVVPIAISVFFYVQWTGISQNGLLGYLHHLAGSPRDIFGWLLAPLMMPLHVMGEFIKPLSLSFRLYGNIMAGHVLLAVFMGLGIEMLKPLKIPAGIPLHFPFLFLEILVGLIQAFVFTLLSTIYISMMLPHEDEEHGHEEHGHEEHTVKVHH